MRTLVVGGYGLVGHTIAEELAIVSAGSGSVVIEVCLERGINYIDFRASDEFFRQVEPLDDSARHGGATAVLSVGLAPVITNLLAKCIQSRADSRRSARTGIPSHEQRSGSQNKRDSHSNTMRQYR